jgi:hypothetical protein
MRHGTPIQDYQLPTKLSVGITIEALEMSLGMVPEYEAREAAVYSHCPWTTWTQEYNSYERACAVAHYRIHLAIESHVSDAADHQMKSMRNRDR